MTEIIAAITGAAGIIVGAGGKWLLELRKQHNTHESARQKYADETAIKVYGDMVKELQRKVDSQESRITELFKSEVECQKRQAELKVRVEHLTKEVDTLRSQLGGGSPENSS